MKGKFIVIEGPDGSGSTYHAKALARRLEEAGQRVILTSEPTDGQTGRYIRGLLSGSSLPPSQSLQLLFCADRAEHVNNLILPAMEKGEFVVSDRYALSTIIYGSATGADRSWLEAVNDVFPKPDLTIITLPPLATCLSRISRREEKELFENEELQQKLHGLYAQAGGDKTIIVDTSGEKANAEEEIWKAVSALLD